MASGSRVCSTLPTRRSMGRCVWRDWSIDRVLGWMDGWMDAARDRPPTVKKQVQGNEAMREARLNEFRRAEAYIQGESHGQAVREGT